MSRGTLGRVAVALALAAALLLSPSAVSGGPGWDIGIGCGYIAVVLLVCLYIFPVRADGLPHGRLFALSQHRLIGWCMLGLALAHVVVLLGVQPLTTRYLVPSAPLFMWCGLLALVANGLLVYSGLAARTAMRSGRGSSLSTLHILLSSLMAVTLGAHLAGSAQLTGAPLQRLFVFILLALPLGWFALRKRSAPTTHFGARQGTHAAAAVALLLLPASVARPVLLEPVLRPAPIGINFPHERHTRVNCVTCHHNYLDHTGMTGCIECHRTRRADLPGSSEATFHIFCRDCHARLAVDGERHGPTRSCSACHEVANTPLDLSQAGAPRSPWPRLHLACIRGRQLSGDPRSVDLDPSAMRLGH